MEQRRVIRRGAFVAVAATIAAFVAAPSDATGPAAAPAPTPGFDKIKHVVVIFQENRSFDETLGQYCLARSSKCDGYFGRVTMRNGTSAPMTQSPDVINPDVPHNVAAQTYMINGGKMDGWNYQGCKPAGAPTNLCLTSYAPSQVPNLAFLSDVFAMSDRTFSMQDSPSFGGHIWAVAASQGGFTGDIPDAVSGVTPGPGWGCDSNKVQAWVDPVTRLTSPQPSCIPAKPGVLDPQQYPYNGAFRPTKVQPIPTIMDRLEAKGMSWRFYASIYQWSICPSFAKCKFTQRASNVVTPTNILSDASKGTLPAFSVLLPTGPGGTGQHPPSSMLTGDNWIGKVVYSLLAGPDGDSTAIFITYDDCGCFYDHVAPGVNPDGTKQGVRVPMVMVSPYARTGFTDSHRATYASVLRFTEKAFGLAALSVNDAAAYDYGGAFDWNKTSSQVRAARKRFRNIDAPLPQSTIDFFRTHPDAMEDAEDDDT